MLYELYTGRRAFQGKSLAEFVRKHRDERPIEPSALVAGLDPAVERAILACLEKEPRRRPSSALVVSAMLTGSDPLEAAIAAGETPSPELVAAAGEAEGLRPARRLGPARLRAGRDRGRAPPGPLVPAPAAAPDREVAGRARGPGAGVPPRRRAGQTPRPTTPGALAWTTGSSTTSARRTRRLGRWEALSKGTPPVLQFWYRQSPRPIVSWLPGGHVYWSKPGLDVTDMAGVTYDTSGRLLRFYAIPPQLESDPASPPLADWPSSSPRRGSTPAPSAR